MSRLGLPTVQHLVSSQCQGIASAHAHCDHCDAGLGFKDWHQRQIKTGFALWSMCKDSAFATAAAQKNLRQQIRDSGGLQRFELLQ
jgi:hypothetical protein